MIRLNENETQALVELLQPEIIRNLNPNYRAILEELHNKLTHTDKVDLYVDGAADLHSKTAGIGGVFYRNGEELFAFSEYLDDATNNDAEYSALIKGLETAKVLCVNQLNIYADSELVVKQINGQYKVKHPRMKILHSKVMILLKTLESWSVQHIPREKNTVADKLSKEGRMKGKRK